MALSQITWHDVQQMPDDGHRREAIGGELHVTAAPSSRHQEISATLAASLHAILVRQGHGRLFHAPGVEFPSTGEGVQADLAFVSQARSEVVEVWDLRGEEPRCRQFTDRLPVRLRGDVVGEIVLAEVFAPGA